LLKVRGAGEVYTPLNGINSTASAPKLSWGCFLLYFPLVAVVSPAASRMPRRCRRRSGEPQGATPQMQALTDLSTKPANVPVFLPKIRTPEPPDCQNESLTLLIAGWLRFFTLIQFGNRPAR
jgi:hypothetical protein